MGLLKNIFGHQRKELSPFEPGRTRIIPGALEQSHEQDSMPFKKGALVDDRFEILKVLGMGGFSVVYLVKDTDSASEYALKTLRVGNEETDASAMEGFRKEARVWINLEPHPNIVRAHFISELEGRLCIGMEYVAPNDAGFNSLDGYIKGAPPDLEQSLRWMIQFCHGMEFARAHGIKCHRDVKPANIMINAEGIVKITDFGFAEVNFGGQAKLVAGRRRSAPTGGFGTPVYMPPEQFKNAPRCDERSDIYSLGIIMFQMAARGRLPFFPTKQDPGGDRLALWNAMHRLHAEAPVPRLASPLFPIIIRCLAKEPRMRYQQFRDLRVDLEALMKERTGKVEEAAVVKDADAWEVYNRAFSLANLGDYEGAIAQYRRALELDPSNADAWNNQGVCFRKLGRMDEAVDSFIEAATRAPEMAAALRNLGGTLSAQGRHADAIPWLQKAVKVDPSNENIWFTKALAEEREGMIPDAIASFKAFLDLPPDALKDYAKYAQDYIERGGRPRNKTHG